MKVKIIVNLIILFCCTSLMGCKNADQRKEITEKVQISDLVGEEVYIWETEKYEPYIVLSNDYNGNSLLLRKHVLDEAIRMNEYFAYYEGCEMDKFLNETFYENLSKQTKGIIENSAIEIVDAGYSYTGHKIKKIERKVFLLSSTELGFNLKYGAGKEGKAIAYFEQSNARIAYTKEKKPSAWWLRSVDIIYDSCFFGISAKGEVGSGNAFDMNGVRPAFCIRSDTPVYASSESHEGKIIYIK